MSKGKKKPKGGGGLVKMGYNQKQRKRASEGLGQHKNHQSDQAEWGTQYLYIK